MRTIAKADAPDCLADAAKNGWSWEEFVTNNHAGYQECRQQANGEQASVCAYTELPLDTEKMTVHLDHYRKKSIYQELRFDWRNLFAAIKDNRFGADYKDNRVSGENEQQVYAVILSPLTENLESYFHYATNGEIEPSMGLSDDNLNRAKETIKIFHLNEDELVSRRRTIMAQIGAYHDLSEEEIKICFEGAGFPSVVEQELRYMFA